MGGNVILIERLEDFEKFISGGAVVVDFFAEWCGPCKRIAPEFDKFSEQYSNVKFCKIDVDNASEITAKYGIRSMPTFFFFKDGSKVSEVIGANRDKIEEEIKKLAA